MSIIVFIHVLHLICAVMWFGSYMWTELILWPRMRAAGHLEAVQGTLRSVAVRQVTAVWIVGTIVTGYARGVAEGVFDRLYEPYGVLFVLAAIVGTWMMVWWCIQPPRTLKWGWRLFYTSFWVIFALMVGLRFTA